MNEYLIKHVYVFVLKLALWPFPVSSGQMTHGQKYGLGPQIRLAGWLQERVCGAAEQSSSAPWLTFLVREGLFKGVPVGEKKFTMLSKQ